MSLAERIGLYSWRHVVKLDPDKPMPSLTIKRIAASGTDAVLIGGTQRITRSKVLRLLWHLRQATVPVVIEMSSEACAVPGADAYFVPVVLNAGHLDWIIGHHLRGLERMGALVPWDRVLVEGYIVGNPASAVAHRVGIRAEVDKKQLRALVQYGAGLLQLPIVYLEFSGRQADTGWVKEASAAVSHIRSTSGAGTRLFYGGGIADFHTAWRMLQQVDTIVVGNSLYQQQPFSILEATLAAARSVPSLAGR